MCNRTKFKWGESSILLIPIYVPQSKRRKLVTLKLHRISLWKIIIGLMIWTLVWNVNIPWQIGYLRQWQNIPNLYNLNIIWVLLKNTYGPRKIKWLIDFIQFQLLGSIIHNSSIYLLVRLMPTTRKLHQQETYFLANLSALNSCHRDQKTLIEANL